MCKFIILLFFIPWVINCDFFQSKVSEKNPIYSFSLPHDTSISVNDTLKFEIISEKQEIDGIKFVIEINKLDYRDTILDGEFTLSLKDTGSFELLIYAVSKSGKQSDPDTFVVHSFAKAPMVELGLESKIFSVKDTSDFNVKANDTDGIVEYYLWSFDNKNWDTTSISSVIYYWTMDDVGNKTLYVKVVDDDGVVSNTDSVVIKIQASAPRVELSSNNELFAINDTIQFVAQANDSDGMIKEYYWSFDKEIWEPSKSSTYYKVWGTNEAGEKTLFVRVVDDDGLSSYIDSLKFNIRKYSPTVSIISNTIVTIYDSLKVTLDAYDTNGVIVSYLYSLDSGKTFEETKSSQKSYKFKLDLGLITYKMLLVKVLDDDGIESIVDTLNVTVKGSHLSKEECSVSLSLDSIEIDSPYDYFFWHNMECFSNVKHIYLGLGVSSASGANFSNFDRLECLVTSMGIDPEFESIPNLKKLKLYRSSVLSANVKFFPNLEELHLDTRDFNDIGAVNELVKLKEIRVLSIIGYRGTHLDLFLIEDKLHNFTKLEKLYLNPENLKLDEQIGDLQYLEEIYLDGSIESLPISITNLSLSGFHLNGGYCHAPDTLADWLDVNSPGWRIFGYVGSPTYVCACTTSVNWPIDKNDTTLVLNMEIIGGIDSNRYPLNLYSDSDIWFYNSYADTLSYSEAFLLEVPCSLPTKVSFYHESYMDTSFIVDIKRSNFDTLDYQMLLNSD